MASSSSPPSAQHPNWPLSKLSVLREEGRQRGFRDGFSHVIVDGGWTRASQFPRREEVDPLRRTRLLAQFASRNPFLFCGVLSNYSEAVPLTRARPPYDWLL